MSRHITAVGPQVIKKDQKQTQERISSPQTAVLAGRVTEEKRFLEVQES